MCLRRAADNNNGPGQEVQPPRDQFTVTAPSLHRWLNEPPYLYSYSSAAEEL